MLSSYRMIRTPGTRKGSTPRETQAIRVLLTDDLALVDPPPVATPVTQKSTCFVSVPWGKRFWTP